MASKRRLTNTTLGPLTFVIGLAAAYLLTRIAHKHGVGLRFKAIPELPQAPPQRRLPKRRNDDE
jgi:hypothetical protein